MVVDSGQEPTLMAEGVFFGYGRESVLSEISIQVRNGEILGIIGPNGSGKSTLLGLFVWIASAASGQGPSKRPGFGFPPS